MEFHELKNSKHFNCTLVQIDEKGKEKVCNGQLKEWTLAPPEILKQIKPGETLLRCRRCNGVYKGVSHRHLITSQQGVGLSPQFIGEPDRDKSW